MLNIFFWFIFGFISGWTVALIVRPEADSKRIVGSGVVGAIGGVFGGVVSRLVAHQPVIDGFDGPGFLVAVLTAVILAIIFNFIFRGNFRT